MPTDLNLFLLVATRIGRRYLSCGGPTSRLEDKLTEAGLQHGFRTEVFATPTGIIVSGVTGDGEELSTLLDRIKESTINLTELLHMERLLQELSHGKTDLKLTLEKLKDPVQHSYPFWMLLSGSFGVGALASHSRFGSASALVLSGLLTTIVFFVSGRLMTQMRISTVFGEFLGCFVALMGAGAFSQILSFPPEAFAVGSIVLLVPGLTITTAISELADQNFASGSIKFMKGALTVFAMATAYFLVRDMALLTSYTPDLWYEKVRLEVWQPYWMKAINNIGLIISFAIIFHVPRRELPLATLTGFIGWVTLQSAIIPNSLAVPAFLASLAVGTASLIFSRFLGVPSQIYSVPGILSLLPGMLALSSFTRFGTSQATSGPETAFSVAIVACSIVFGLFLARFPFIIFRR